MSGCTWYLDPPVESGARNRQVVKSAFYETGNFVQPFARQYEIRNALVEIEQLVLIGRQAEEISFLLSPLHWRAQRLAADSVGADRCFSFVEIGFLTNRIPSRVFVEIDIAIFLKRYPERLTGALMTRLRGADVIVI